MKTKRVSEFFGRVRAGGTETEWAFDWGFWELRVLMRIEMVSVVDDVPGYICSNVEVRGGTAASRRYIAACQAGHPEQAILAMLERLMLGGRDGAFELADSGPCEESYWYRDGDTDWIHMDIRSRRLGDRAVTTFRFGDILAAIFETVSAQISAAYASRSTPS